MHLVAAQVDIAVAQAQFVGIVFLPGHLQRQHAGSGLEHKFTRPYLDISRGQIRVAGALFAQNHFASDGYHAFNAHMFDRFHDGRTRGDNNLGNAGLVAQVNEQQPTVVPLAVYPAGQAGCGARIVRAKGRAAVGTVGVHGCVLNSGPLCGHGCDRKKRML